MVLIGTYISLAMFEYCWPTSSSNTHLAEIIGGILTFALGEIACVVDKS